LIEHTNAYATLANNGKFVPYNPILKIEDSQGNVLYDAAKEHPIDKANQAIDPGYAYQISSILTDDDARQMIFGPNLFGQTQRELGRPTAAKSGTTDGWKDIWTMGYTTDVAVGVWVGNTTQDGPSPSELPEFDGIQGAGPIWQKMMYEIHGPEWSNLLVGPDGNPMPEDFPRPSDVYEGSVCASTGNQATPGYESKQEILVRGGGPYLACDQLSAEQDAELNAAVDALRNGAKWTNGAQDKIRRYQSAVDGGGDSITSYDSNDSSDSGDNFNDDEEPPIEPLN
jgi:membrane peptidoglycan carboxypeptidase